LAGRCRPTGLGRGARRIAINAPPIGAKAGMAPIETIPADVSAG
jgi:hypothetical protein